VIELSDYSLETLRKDGEFILYRGVSQQKTGASAPLIFAVTPSLERPALATLRKLEHEYSFKADLDPAWAIRPLALAQHNGRMTLVLENPGGETLDRLLQRPIEIAQFLRFGIGLAGALGRLHERGLIHKDVKPPNVLVNSATGQVWLTGFGIASRLPRERQSPEPPEFIAGTLPYMAPEQTGRMNRSIDSRSDLYALGVTLYEMLTGRLPFTASEPAEWVHCHIARQPVPPGERLRGIPRSVSAIIMKLLTKTAEERYQTAAGVESDLRRCLAEWESQGGIAEFPLGKHDIPDRLLIPEKLYGRGREIATLLNSFDRVVEIGKPELVLVSGFSGVGKSSVVSELHKVLVLPRGLFAAGKFDQYKRDIPYATLAQAFQGLIRALLSKSDAELASWRNALGEALGPNGLLITDLVPELKHIIGEQPAVPVLPPQEAQGRFQLVFRRFIGVFARPEHPLALFLDDLQWLDSATLDLLEDLLTRPDVRHLLLIGAYRDNEIHSGHPLMRKLEAIRRAGASVREILLAPLTGEDLEQLLAESFHCEPERVESLAQLVHEKTAGNPFFAIQFINSLAEEALLTFDHGEARWSWDLNRIHAKGYTDNVVDLMVGKFSRLSLETQKALRQLACLGNSVEFALLAMAYEDSKKEIHGDLREAVRTGLVLRSENAYRFLHDRVQEAAYSFIPEGERGSEHLRIGRLLALRTAPEELEDKIFEIVSQLNRGSRLIASAQERERVAELNLIAGRRAKSSTAYDSALAYLSAGRELLEEDAWEDNYELIYDLEFHLAECELQTANLAAAELRLSNLALRAKSVRHVGAVVRLRLTLYTTLDRSDRGVEVFLDYLRRGGTNWSPHPTGEQVRHEYDRIWLQLGSRSIEELIDLPLMSDPESLAALDVLTETVTPALFTDENLLSLVICRMVNLSLEHGNRDGSCFAYVWLGMVAGPHFHNYDAGFRFGRLGYDLVEKRGLHRFQARTYMSFGNLVMPWTRHVRAGRDLVRRAFETANRIGDLTFAAYSCNNLNTNLLATGDPLMEVQREAESGLEFAQKARFGLVIDIVTAQLGLVRTLRGLTPKFGCLDHGPLNELQFERHLASDTVLALPECWYWIRKLQARFLARDYPAAIQASENARRLLWTSPSFFEVAEYQFYSALSRAAICDSAAPDQRTAHLEALASHEAQLKIWAENCPENFGNRAALVAAEIARHEGRDHEAIRLYEQAIESARANGFIHNEAVAHELAAGYHLSRGATTAGRAHLEAARDRFALWGADGKVRQLEQLHPYLGERPVPVSASNTFGASVDQLDVGTVVKASQALSSEIVLSRLIEKLMRITVEHAGAERGLFILLRDNEPQIEAEASTGLGQIEVAVRESPVTSADLPRSALNYVIRTKERVVLDDASADDMYMEDEYVRRRGARSVLCLPIVKQTRLVGVLYLENNLTPRAFTANRVTVLELLASQAAISLENARLYSELQRSERFLAEAQSLGTTGSFGWNSLSGEVQWSDETYRIYEYDRTIKPTLELAAQRIHPADRADRQRIFDLARDQRATYDSTYRLLMPDGRIKHLHVFAHAVRSASGELEFVGAVMDVTSAKRAEEALRQAQANLAHVSRVTTMGELTASIAHEVNQPLTAVVNNANACLSLLPQRPSGFAEIREALGDIIEDADRASAIIARVRQLAKKAPFKRTHQDLGEVIADVVALARLESAARRTTIRTVLADGLPLAFIDRVQLQQVLLNLVVNGLEAMNTIEETKRVIILFLRRELREGKPESVVSVQDAGTGINPEEKDRLFEAFYTTKPQGMGMGLAISRSIIEAHGGRLWVERNPGPGTTFHFSLPDTISDDG
jgi:predicted ATPase/signal transduction histidine kinase